MFGTSFAISLTLTKSPAELIAEEFGEMGLSLANILLESVNGKNFIGWILGVPVVVPVLVIIYLLMN